MSGGPPIWQLVLDCARSLTGRGLTPFELQQLIACVQAARPELARGSIGPTVQGMTHNAPGGPPSAGGTPLVRVGRGLYQLAGPELPGPSVSSHAPSRPRERWGRRRTDRVDARLDGLIAEFDRYVEAYDRFVPFQRSRQFAQHREVIEQRRAHARLEDGLADDGFLQALHQVLQAWGIGVRGSRLAPWHEFAGALRAQSAALIDLEPVRLGDEENDADVVTPAVWQLVDGLAVVDNHARIVAGTKALHHLLPDLVPPMDRWWTGAFFGWTTADPQYDQQRTFSETFRRFDTLAQRTNPSRLVGVGWRTSATKILDNAVIGYCIEHEIGPGRRG